MRTVANHYLRNGIAGLVKLANPLAAGIPTTPWPIPATRAAIKAVSLDLAAEA